MIGKRAGRNEMFVTLPAAKRCDYCYEKVYGPFSKCCTPRCPASKCAISSCRKVHSGLGYYCQTCLEDQKEKRKQLKGEAGYFCHKCDSLVVIPKSEIPVWDGEGTPFRPLCYGCRAVATVVQEEPESTAVAQPNKKRKADAERHTSGERRMQSREAHVVDQSVAPPRAHSASVACTGSGFPVGSADCTGPPT